MVRGIRATARWGWVAKGEQGGVEECSMDAEALIRRPKESSGGESHHHHHHHHHHNHNQPAGDGVVGAPGGDLGAKAALYPNGVAASVSRLRVEKIEGGLMVAGVVVAANCQIILPIFGFLFLLVGIVLTAASYRGPGADEEPDHYAHRIAFTGNSRILGPACIVVGFLMSIAGLSLCLLTRRARRREQTIGFHCPLHGDFYPLSNVNSSKTIAAIEKGSGTVQLDNASGNCWCCWPSRRRGPGAIAVGPPQCPHSQVSSTRSSLASSSPHSQCPTPKAFVITSSGSIGGIGPTVAQLSPDQPFGSIRSLAPSREVASFPMSRTPTPPASKRESLASPHLVHVPDEEHLVNSADDDKDDDYPPPPSSGTSSCGPRKSVSIVLPEQAVG